MRGWAIPASLLWIVKMEENQKRVETGRAAAFKTMEAISGHGTRPRHGMRLHLKKDPEVSDQGGSVGPKPGKQINLKTGRGSERERGCQQKVGPHGRPPWSLRCRALLWSPLRKEPSLTVHLGLMVGEGAGSILSSTLEVGGEVTEKDGSASTFSRFTLSILRKFFEGRSQCFTHIISSYSQNNPKGRIIINFLPHIMKLRETEDRCMICPKAHGWQVLVRNLDPDPCDSGTHLLSPCILALPEEARENMLEMKSTQVFSEKAALGPHGAFPILEPLLPRPYHILVDELPQVPEAVLLGNGVGVVAVLVGHTIGL